MESRLQEEDKDRQVQREPERESAVSGRLNIGLLGMPGQATKTSSPVQRTTSREGGKRGGGGIRNGKTQGLLDLWLRSGAEGAGGLD